MFGKTGNTDTAHSARGIDPNAKPLEILQCLILRDTPRAWLGAKALRNHTAPLQRE